MDSEVIVPLSLRDCPYAAGRFRSIVQYAKEHHPFYRDWLGDSQTVPIIDRETFLKHNDQILNGHTVTARTSGSTGVPVRISQSNTRVKMDVDDQKLLVKWLGGLLPVTRIIYPPSNVQHDWLLPISESIDRQIEVIVDRFRSARAVALTTYPSNGELLATEILQRGIDMSFMQRVGLYAESFDDSQETIIRRAFPNAQIWSTYSSMEFGMIAIRCPCDPSHYHLMSHKLGVELLKLDEDAPVAEGEVGRVVVTDYFNQQSPLIRYELGDLV